MFIVDHEDSNAGLGFRPDGEQGRRLPSLGRGAHAVLSKRYRHRLVLGFRLTAPYAGFGPTCRGVAATRILRTTTGKSVDSDVAVGPGPHQGASSDRTRCTDLRHAGG